MSSENHYTLKPTQIDPEHRHVWRPFSHEKRSYVCVICEEWVAAWSVSREELIYSANQIETIQLFDEGG